MSKPDDIEFTAIDGLTLRGHLYSAGSKRPCIIMTHGFSGLKEDFLPDFAAKFNGAGYTVIVYDNRNWGASDGLPREHVDPLLQTRDYVDAFDYASTLPSVDPAKIIFWGSSMSGGNAVCAAAFEKRVCAVVVQVPFVSGEFVARALAPIHDMLLTERGAVRRGAAPTMVPVTPATTEEAVSGNSKAVLRDPNSIEFKAEMDRRGYKHSDICTFQSAIGMILHEPQALVHRLAPTPLLMVIAEKDVTIPASTQLEMYAKALEPKRLHILKGAGHFNPYYGECFEENITAQLAFLKDMLG